jgi:type VI secretion system protein ImpH
LQRNSEGISGNSFSDTIYSMLGMDSSSVQGSENEWIFQSLLSNRFLFIGPRSASNLTLWLREQFNGLPISLDEFVPTWIKIPINEQTQLGIQNSYLSPNQDSESEGMTIGEWLEDRETKFRINLGPLKFKDFLAFLPGRKGYSRLVALVHLFIPDWLQFDLSVSLLGYDCRHLQVCLDGKTSQLGYTAGLFPKEGSPRSFTLTLELESAA